MYDNSHRPLNLVYEDAVGAILTGTAGSYINAGHKSTFLLSSGAVSFSFTPEETEGRKTLVSKNGSGHGNGGDFTLQLDGSQLLLSMETTDRTYMLRIPEVEVLAGETYHLTLSFGDEGLSIWLDGAIVAAAPEFTYGIEANSRDLLFGGSNADFAEGQPGANALFKGEISNIALFDKQLTHEQILSEASEVVPDKALLSLVDETLEELAPAFQQAHHGSETLKELLSEFGFDHTGVREEPFILQVGNDGADDLVGTYVDDGINGELGDDTIHAAEGDDVVQGGYGNDDLYGGEGNDVLDGGHGEDLLRGGAGDDWLVSQADGREGYIASVPGRDEGDPYNELTNGKLYPYQPIPADDVLEGGSGADTFYFQLLINAKERYIRKHTKADGNINWHGVAGENDKLHDHWVDVLGNDTILDYSRSEGDRIIVEGHTTEIFNITYGDANNDGVLDHSVIHLYSDQGANGGAHQYDQLGTITVYGDLVQEGDIEQNAAPPYGIVKNIKDLEDALSPVTSGSKRTSPVPEPILETPATEIPGGQTPVFFAPGTMRFERSEHQEMNFGSPDNLSISNGTIAFSFNLDNLKWGSTLFSKEAKGKSDGHMSVRIDQFGTITITVDDNEKGHVIKIPNTIQADVDYDFALSFGDQGLRVMLNGVELASLADVTVGWDSNFEDLILGAGAWGSTPGTSDKVYGYMDGTISNFLVFEGQLTAEDLYGAAPNETVYVLEGNPTDYSFILQDDGSVEILRDNVPIELEGSVEFLQFDDSVFHISQIQISNTSSGTLRGKSAGELMIGSSSNDRLVGNGGDDYLLGYLGADKLFGGDGNDTLIGGEGDDGLYGNDGDDTLKGGSGNDKIYGGLGADTFIGGEGDDLIFANHRGDAGTEALDYVKYLGNRDDYEIDVLQVYNGTRGEYMTQVRVTDDKNGGFDGIDEGFDKLMDIDILIFADQVVHVDDLMI